jgi:uncharacterized protein YukE
MADSFKTPPQGDFASFASLMDKQAGHFGDLAGWARKECGEASDLTGDLVLAVAILAPKLAEAIAGKLDQCNAGMSGVAGKARRTAQAYLSTDSGNADMIARLYGQPLPDFPDISRVPGVSHLGDFNDEGISFKDLDPAGDDTAKNIALQLEILGHGTDAGSKGIQKTTGLSWGPLPNSGLGNFSGKLLAEGDKIFRYFTGQSLVALLFWPIVGNYGRLKYLSEAYDQLADNTYTVTGTVRKGSVRLGGEWQGDAAVAFDSLMFRWSMGSGGLGDAATVLSHAFRDGYYAVCALVQIALQAITRLINNEIKQLVETEAGDAAIEAVGGGPEDPVADLVAAAWTAYKLYEIVKAIVTAIKEISKIFDEIKDAVSKIEKDVKIVIDALKQPLDVSGMVNSLLDDVRQRGFEFEKNGAWNPELGAARIALLPSP